MLRGGKSEPQLSPVVDRQIERSLGLDGLVIPKGHLAIASEGLVRLVGDHIDEPTGRIAAEERTLGSAQHLDAVHVVQGIIEYVRQVVIEVVKCHGYPRADAALAR